MHARSAGDELDQLLNKNVPGYVRVMDRLAASIVRSNSREHAAAMAHLTEIVGATLTLSNLMGRRRFMLQVDARGRKRKLAYVGEPEVPKVEFVEAVQDLLGREPRLARSAAEVSHLYNTQYAFAAAKSADVAITKRVQEAIKTAMRQGQDVPTASELIRDISGSNNQPSWTQAYSETVYRTNVSTAYTTGQFEQAADPDFREVAPAFKYSATLDSSCRDNHAAADGLIADTRDPIWLTFAPPMGYNCRCSLDIVDAWDLRQLGLVDDNGRVQTYKPPTFSAAHPDKGFGTRSRALLPV